MTASTLKFALARPISAAVSWLREERAALAVEAAIMLPVLGVFYVGGVVYFQGYRKEAVLTKATYTIGDLLSRQEGVVTATDLEGMDDMFEFLTFSEDDSWLRITELRRAPDGAGLEIIWSYATEGNPEMTPTRLGSRLNRVPTLRDNERIVLLETFTEYESGFQNLGFSDRRFEMVVATRQRYVAQLPFEDNLALLDPDIENTVDASCNASTSNDPDDVVDAGSVSCGTSNGSTLDSSNSNMSTGNGSSQ